MSLLPCPENIKETWWVPLDSAATRSGLSKYFGVRKSLGAEDCAS